MADEPTKEEVIEQIVEIASEYDITPVEIGAAMGVDLIHKPEPVKLPPKFRDPVSGETWAGRGKRPNWLGNRDPEDFRILP